MRTRLAASLALVLAAAGTAVAAESGRYTGATDDLGSIQLKVASNRVTVVHYITGMRCVERGPAVEADEDTVSEEDVERTFRPAARIAGNRFSYRKANAAGTRSFSLTGRVSGRTIRGVIREYQLKRERFAEGVNTITCRGSDTYVARMR